MNTLVVQNGDLVLANGSFSTVTGPTKVEQDIQIATLTPYGSDRFHPRYGSVFSSYIGSAINPQTSALISAELTRVINNYMAVQLGKVKQAAAAGLTSPFSQGELVQAIGTINVQQQYDRFQVSASVVTASGQQVNVSTTVTTASS
jgi:phage baseplate assembly protein W